VSNSKSATSLSGAYFVIKLDSQTGAITTLRNKRTGFDWASPDHPLGLLSYQTLSKEDYDRFLASYITVQNEWAPKDFGKPNIESFGAVSKLWPPELIESTIGETDGEHRLLARLRVQAGENTGCPREFYLEAVLPKMQPLVHLNVSWFGKLQNRLPEALWLTFRPKSMREGNWILTKVEQSVSPKDVVSGGNRHMHALSSEICYQSPKGRFAIQTLDAPVVSLGVRSPIYFSKSEPDPAQGLHFSLFNNGWGTNYVQWFGEDMRFRFVIRG
jgi:hypothetical protein